MNQEIVSIIVPMYKVEKYVAKCLDSLLAQTYSAIRIYAISDGSPDKSYEIAKEYAKRDARIIPLKKKNGGYGSVLEMAIQMIDTECFMICDPDDYLREDAVEKLFNFAHQNDLDMVVGAKNLIYSDNEEAVYSSSWGEMPRALPNKIYTNIKHFFFLEPSPHSKLYRTSLCKDIKFPHKVNYTDNLLYLLTLGRVNKIAYLEEALSYYLIDRPGNSTVVINEKTFNDQLIVLNSILEQAQTLNREIQSYYAILFYDVLDVLDLMKHHATKEAKEKYFLAYTDLIIRLSRYKKDILNILPNLSKKRRMVYYFLLSPSYSRKVLMKMIRL